MDASPVGLSAILTQVDANNIRRIISYASRSLSDIEQRFSQTEREELACVWACEHYHRYIYGAPTFDLITDHQPLQVIYRNPRAKLPARIKRWGLRLMPYSFKVVHCQGRQNPADYCSRHPNPSTQCRERTTKITEEYINLVIEAAVPPAMNTDMIKHHTMNDQVLQRILSLIRSNKWQDAASDPDLRPFYNICDELCTNADNDIILRGTRIVLPQSLHQQAINIAHEGHQGIVRTKRLLRHNIWFPNIDKLTEQTLQNCLACLATTPETINEPIKMSPLPPAVWSHLSADFLGPLSDGSYLLVIICDYSRFPIVEIIHSTSSWSRYTGHGTCFCTFRQL